MLPRRVPWGTLLLWTLLCGLLLSLGAQTGWSQELTGLAEATKAAKAAGTDTSLGQRLMSFVGLFAFIGVAYLFSWDRSKIDWKMVGWGVALQIGFGLLILRTDLGRVTFEALNQFFNALIGYTDAGSGFLFGPLIDPEKMGGMVFAFSILPTIIFFSSLMAVLYYLGIVQRVVLAMAKVMEATMGVSGAEALSSAANVFVGQTEAPLVVRPYVNKMTMSELHALMCGGMATVAGGVMAAYVGMGISAGHLLSASVMSAPAALLMAKILVPETGEPETKGKVELDMEQIDVNAIDAAARGAGEGLQLALNVGAMLLAFLALIAMLNGIFGMLHAQVTTYLPFLAPYWPESLEVLCGWIFYPFAWLMGIPSQDCSKVAQLLGVKTILNEFVAYSQMGGMMKNPETALETRSFIISTYALCGFANFSSIAIQLGGLGSLAPERRPDLSRLGLWCLLGGTLACYMTATVAGMLI